MLDPLGTLAGVRKATKAAARDIRALERKGVKGEVAAESEENGDSIRYSINMDFSGVTPATLEESVMMDATDKRNLARYIGEVDRALNRTLPFTQKILIGRPSPILSQYMKSDNPLYMTQRAAKKIAFGEGEKAGKHGLGKAVLYELPFHLADPLAITGNTTIHTQRGENSVVVWTDWVSENGDGVILPIRIDRPSTEGPYNQGKTMFVTDNPAYTADLLRPGNVYYTRDGKSISELLKHGRQLPELQLENASSENEDTTSSKKVNREKEKTSTEIEAPYNRTALLTEDTVDRWLKDYASASSPKYAQAYIARMSPNQFLKLTTSRTGRRSLRQGPRGPGLGRSRQPFREEVIAYPKKPAQPSRLRRFSVRRRPLPPIRSPSPAC